MRERGDRAYLASFSIDHALRDRCVALLPLLSPALIGGIVEVVSAHGIAASRLALQHGRYARIELARRLSGQLWRGLIERRDRLGMVVGQQRAEPLAWVSWRR